MALTVLGLVLLTSIVLAFGLAAAARGSSVRRRTRPAVRSSDSAGYYGIADSSGGTDCGVSDGGAGACDGGGGGSD